MSNIPQNTSPLLSFEELVYALQQRNLVYNHDFRYFSNKEINSSVITYNHPDGWVYEDPGAGGQIGLDNNCCRITTSEDDKSKMRFSQALHEFPRWQNVLLKNKVTAKVYLNISQNCVAEVVLTDGVNTMTQTITEEGDAEVVLNLNVSPSASKLIIAVESCSESEVISVSACYVNVGETVIKGLPCMVCGVIGERKQYLSTQNAPAEELSLCQEPVALNSNQTRLNSVINGRFGKNNDGYSLLPDLRGFFSRSWNNKGDRDPDAVTRKMLGDDQVTGDLVGTEEQDMFKHHYHQIDHSPVGIISADKGTPAQGLKLKINCDTQETGGKETRSKNVSELYTLKWA